MERFLYEVQVSICYKTLLLTGIEAPSLDRQVPLHTSVAGHGSTCM